MRNALLIASIIAMSAGVSQADRFHGSRGGARVADHRGPAGGARVVDHRGSGRYEGRAPVRYEGRADVRYGGRGYYEGRGYYDGRGYYEGRRYYEGPRVHYYNRWQRPALYVEHYDVRPGFIWVHGDWSWDGYEWIWTPGHYVREGVGFGVYIR